MAVLSREFDISGKTGYKILQRYEGSDVRVSDLLQQQATFRQIAVGTQAHQRNRPSQNFGSPFPICGGYAGSQLVADLPFSCATVTASAIVPSARTSLSGSSSRRLGRR
jgi:hypothetical protein